MGIGMINVSAIERPNNIGSAHADWSSLSSQVCAESCLKRGIALGHFRQMMNYL